MKTALRAACSPLLGLALMSFTQRDTALTQTAPTTGNTIKLLALNQPPCSIPTDESVITAKLAYHIAEQEQSEYGFEVSIKFQGTDPRMTFSMSRGPANTGNIKVTSKSDTLTLTYPMATILNNPRLRRPITCYFYLHRNTEPGRSVVIAKTPPIIFAECQ
ncbi:hypothetical protein [Hymenobacter cavernae]|uniref:Uncharacterized protein n=1 Tax=Hymenobacter cavernae TaxID=2044852 RepID=A0ABQ1URI1_9BACT|nr:hypothetical protein [Hymenobacter cavernae]GGF24803.1 hypothetical protein GCM10011383_40470 [Hymenobacter cavernae]